MPPLPDLPANEVIPYSAIRYVDGYTKSFVHEYATAYAKAYAAPLLARVAELQAELARTERNRGMWKQQCFVQAVNLAEMREALQKIARMDYGNPYASDCADTARAALAANKEQQP